MAAGKKCQNKASKPDMSEKEIVEASKCCLCYVAEKSKEFPLMWLSHLRRFGKYVGRQTNKTRKKMASKKFRSISRRKIAFQILFELQSFRLHICHFLEQFKCHVSVKCQSARWLSIADTSLTNASHFDFNYNFNLRLISWVIQVRILIKMTTASSLFNCHMNGTWNQTSGGKEERDLCRDPRRCFYISWWRASVAIESIEEKALRLL